jgi:hypothetical protein
VQEVRQGVVIEAYRWDDNEEELHPGDVLTLIGINEEEEVCAGAVNGKIVSIPKRYLRILSDPVPSPPPPSTPPPALPPIASAGSPKSLAFPHKAAPKRGGPPLKKTATVATPDAKGASGGSFSLSKATGSGWTRATATNRDARASIILGQNFTGDGQTAADTLANIFVR